MSKTPTNLIKTDSAKGKKRVVSGSESDRRNCYKENQIAELEKILKDHGLTDEESIKKRGRKYLGELALGWRKYKGLTIPTFTEKDEIGELALKWRKYKGLTNQEEITEARQKRRFWMINYRKHYKRGSQEKTLDEKTKKETASEETLEEKTKEGAASEKILKQFYETEKKASEVKNELRQEYGFKDECSYKGLMKEYLNHLSKRIIRIPVGEKLLELGKIKGWITPEAIIKIRNLGRCHQIYKKKEKERKKEHIPTDYKKEPSKETLDEKTNGLGADYNKNESYKTLIKMIKVEVKKMPGKTKKQKEIRKNFIVEELATNLGEHNIKSYKDIVNIKEYFVEYFGKSVNFGDILSKKAKIIHREICNGTLIPEEKYKEYIPFIEMEGYTDIEGAISSGKISIMRYVCEELQGWIISEMKNKKHYNESSLKEGLKIEEPIKLSSVKNLLNKGVDLNLYQKEHFTDVLKECVATEYVDVIIWETIKELS